MKMTNSIAERLRVEYASGLISNTDMVMKHNKLYSVQAVIEVLTYSTFKDVRTDLQERIEAMKMVHLAIDLYRADLVIKADSMLEDDVTPEAMLDEEMSSFITKRKEELYKEVSSELSWLPSDFVERFNRG